MNLKKSIISVFLVLILFSSTLLGGCEGGNRHSKLLLKLSEKLEQGELDELSLVIYYMNPYAFTTFPVSISYLIESRHEQEVIINGSLLRDHVDLIKQIANTHLIQIDQDSYDEQEHYEDVRLCYVFRNNKNNIIFSVAMWGREFGIYVNGIEVEENDVFYDILLQFLPEDAAETFESCINADRSE